MSDEAEVAALVSGAVLDALWWRFGGTGDVARLDAEYEEWKAVAVAAVEALPVTERGEGQETPTSLVVLRAWWARVTDAHFDSCATGDPGSGACDCTATSEGEYAMAASAYEVAYVTHQRDAARDLAFRAAFAPEFPFKDVSIADETAARRALRLSPSHRPLDSLVTWKPVTP